MVRIRKIDKPGFEDVVKELSSHAEMLGTKQHTKQTVMDTFDGEVEEYRGGRISRKALRATVPEVNKELRRLDGETRAHIASIEKVARKISFFARRQNPDRYKATTSGVRRAEIDTRREKIRRR